MAGHDLPLNMTRNASKAKIEELLKQQTNKQKRQINKRSSLKARGLNSSVTTDQKLTQDQHSS